MKKNKLLPLLLFAFSLSVSGQTTITPSQLLGSKTDTTGVVFLNDETPALVGNAIGRVEDIRSINSKKEGGYEMIPFNPYAFSLNSFQVDYNTALALSKAGKMPEISWQNSSKEQKDFFRKGLSFQNSVSSKFEFTKNEIIELAFGQNRTNNPVPQSNHEIYNALLKVERLRTGNFTSGFGVSGSSRANRLTNFGASHSRLFNAVLSNNIDEFPHSELPDKSANKELLTYLNTNYRYDVFNTIASFSFNKQWDERTMGTFASAAISPLLRNEELSDLRAGISSNYRLASKGNSGFNFLANYSFNRTENIVDRMNTTVFNGFRNAHEIIYGASYKSNNYNYDDRIQIDLRNKHYFSNTTQYYTNFFPAAGVAIHIGNWLDDVLDDIFWNWSWRSLSQFKLFGSAGRSIGEASLVYRNYAALTTEMNAVKALSSFYEDREIVSQTKKMTPEIYENYEAGLQTTFLDYKVYLQLTLFNNKTRNMIAPRSDAGQFSLQNIGDMRSNGFLINASYSNEYYRDRRFLINLNFSKIRNKVLSVAGGREKVALAGFSDIGSYFAEGEPLGVVFGSAYQRTSDGAIVVDENGLPLIEGELKKIGDPTPDFIIGIAPNWSWKKFDCSFSMNYNVGGKRWNGTKQFFENLPTKAAEDYIEDASCLRLSQIAASYAVIRDGYKFIRDLNVGVSAQNLFVISPYKGTDPATNLFGYTTGKGLDFFNMPSLRSYQLFVNIKF